MDAFLRELQAAGTGDLNAVFATLNDGGLCRQALAYWAEKDWVAVAPHSPLLALRGKALHRGVTLHEFCGEQPPAGDSNQPAAPDVAAKGESKSHEHS